MAFGLANFAKGFEGVRLKTLAESPLKYGANEAAEFDDREWPRFVRITDVTSDGQLRDETFRSLPPDRATGYELTVGDILMARSGATVGKTFIYDLSWGAACYAGYLIRFRTKKSSCPRFIYWFMQSENYWANIRSNLIQSTIQNFSAEKFGSIPIPQPPLETQRRIAAFLDEKTARIDGLIEKKRRLLELLAEKRQALITQAVTKGLDPSAPMKPSGIDWLGDIPAHWEVVSLNKITRKITNGYVGPTRDIFVDKGVPYIQSLHIKNDEVKFGEDYFVTEEWSLEHSKSILKKDDVLIVQTGSIGQVAVVPEQYDGCNCHALIICEPEYQRLFGKYLAICLRSDYGQEFLQMVKTGALHPHLNCGKVKFFQVVLPPFEEQEAIVNFIIKKNQSLGKSSVDIRSSIDRLQEYRSALITAAVTGQLDVGGA